MSTPRYMILDNDNISAELLIELLEHIGDCICQVFTSPLQLLSALNQNEPDLIFCNATAIGCDARELCKNKEINSPMVFISALTKHEERRRCFLDSAHQYITSPLNTDLIQKHLSLK